MTNIAKQFISKWVLPPISVSRTGFLPAAAAMLVFTHLISNAQADDQWPWPPAAFEELTGEISIDARLFPEPAAFAGQERHSASIAFEPEYYMEWEDYSSLRIKPFVRVDSSDPGRTHADIRELFLRLVRDDWELGVGAGKVFWGVTEVKHLVDVINQTDAVENVDGEDKLGQPMINLTFIRDWGYVDLFYLPYFRERTFAERSGRLRNRFIVDTSQTNFDSNLDHWHPDLAVRFKTVIGDWDLGFAHFYGTNREPTFSLGFSSGGEPVLVPEYELINQTSVDVQLTTGAWLWKLEGLFRQGQKNRRLEEENFYSFIGGFEYTFYGIFDSVADLGILMEYMRDSRLDRATDPQQNDVFIGFRLAFNDAPDTQILAGMTQDLEDHSRFSFVEASRRIGESWKLTAEWRGFHGFPSADLLNDIRDDDHLRLELGYFF